MKRLKKLQRSIGTRFMVASVLLITCLILVSYLFSAWYMVRTTESKLLEDYNAAMDFTMRQIDRYQDDLFQFSVLLTSDGELQKLLAEREGESEAEKIKSSTAICRVLRNYELLRGDCICVELLLDDGGIYTSDSSNKNSLHSTGDLSWMEELDGMARRDFSRGHALLSRNFYYDTVITYSCDMGNYLTNKTKIGKLFLHIKQEAFKNLVYETDNGYSWCALLNSRGNVLAESGEKDEEIQKILEERNKEGKRIQEGKNGWLLQDSQSEPGLGLAMYMPKDRFRNEERNIFLFFVLLFIACLILSCFVMLVITKRLSRPIVALSNAARQISEGKLDVHLQAEMGDEMGTLTESFNQMAGSLEKQMRDLQKAERVRSDLQMSILMAQINPHFIYNTLNSAIYLSKVGEARKAERLLQLFICLLQNNMKSGIDGMITTIGEDVKDLEGYAELQKIRYPGRFDFEIDADEKLYDHAIPRLILQPLVENSLNHGVLSREYGKICLKIYEERERIIFELSDDGEGMDEVKIREILSQKSADKRRRSGNIHSISIENIFQRLGLIYQEDYIFEINSRPGEGTTIYISVPLEYRRNTQGGEENEERTEH